MISTLDRLVNDGSSSVKKMTDRNVTLRPLYLHSFLPSMGSGALRWPVGDASGDGTLADFIVPDTAAAFDPGSDTVARCCAG